MPEPQETQAHQAQEGTDVDVPEIGRVEELSCERRISDTMMRDVKFNRPSMRVPELLEILRGRHTSGLRYWKRMSSILRE